MMRSVRLTPAIGLVLLGLGCAAEDNDSSIHGRQYASDGSPSSFTPTSNSPPSEFKYAAIVFRLAFSIFLSGFCQQTKILPKIT